jgi:hypothetical protein
MIYAQEIPESTNPYYTSRAELTFYLRASMKHSGILVLTWRYYIPLKHATRQYSKEKWERPLYLGLLNQS